MQCASPINIKNPSPGTNNRITVPCGRCAACLTNRRSQWYVRLYFENKNSKNSAFITLTYNEENVTTNDWGIKSLNKSDIQLFMKRFRKNINFPGIKYFLTSEYGTETFRPHYHMLLFNLPLVNDLRSILEKSWQKGFVHIGKVQEESINYCTGYIMDKTKVPETLS